jgi:hypothetical protein
MELHLVLISQNVLHCCAELITRNLGGHCLLILCVCVCGLYSLAKIHAR